MKQELYVTHGRMFIISWTYVHETAMFGGLIQMVKSLKPINIAICHGETYDELLKTLKSQADQYCEQETPR